MSWFMRPRSGARNADSTWQRSSWVRVCARLPLICLAVWLAVWLAGFCFSLCMFFFFSTKDKLPSWGGVMAGSFRLVFPSLEEEQQREEETSSPLGLHQFLKMTVFGLT